jgi:hypothetical protein
VLTLSVIARYRRGNDSPLRVLGYRVAGTIDVSGPALGGPALGGSSAARAAAIARATSPGLVRSRRR